jgi:hypothetical protein
MTHGFAYFTLLASSSRLRALGSGVRGRDARIDSSDVVTMVVVLAVVVLGVTILSWYVARRDRRRSFTNPHALFHALSKAHGIDRRGRRLLGKMVRWYRLKQPAQLFVEPERFELSRLSPELQREGAAITALSKRLFRQPMAKESKANASRRAAEIQPVGSSDPPPIDLPAAASLGDCSHVASDVAQANAPR